MDRSRTEPGGTPGSGSRPGRWAARVDNSYVSLQLFGLYTFAPLMGAFFGMIAAAQGELLWGLLAASLGLAVLGWPRRQRGPLRHDLMPIRRALVVGSVAVAMGIVTGLATQGPSDDQALPKEGVAVLHVLSDA